VVFWGARCAAWPIVKPLPKKKKNRPLVVTNLSNPNCFAPRIFGIETSQKQLLVPAMTDNMDLPKLCFANDDFDDYFDDLASIDLSVKAPYFDLLMGELGGGVDFDEMEHVMGVLRGICHNFTSRSSFEQPMTLEQKEASFKQLEAELVDPTSRSHSTGRNATPDRAVQNVCTVKNFCTVTIETGKLGINVYETGVCSPGFGKYAVAFNKFSSTSSEAKSQSAGLLKSGMLLTHVNGEDQRGKLHTQVLASLRKRPCRIKFAQLSEAKKLVKQKQPSTQYPQQQQRHPLSQLNSQPLGAWKRARANQSGIGWEWEREGMCKRPRSSECSSLQAGTRECAGPVPGAGAGKVPVDAIDDEASYDAKQKYYAAQQRAFYQNQRPGTPVFAQ
jgi:hypothetical protein